MHQLRTTLVTGGLILALLAGAAAQVRDSRSSAPAAGVITGLVEIETNQQRAPVRWARLTLSATVGGKTWTTTSDRDGRYRFDEVAAGDYRLRAEKPGFVAAPLDVRAAGSGTVTTNLDMQRGGAIEGRFIDDRGEAIANLAVTAVRHAGGPQGSSMTEAYSAWTDDLGRFRVHTLPAGQYRLHATAPPPASGERMFYPGTTDPTQAGVITVVAGETREGVDLTVAAAPLSPIAAETLAAAAREADNAPEQPGFTARISGQLVAIETGQPIANGSVEIASTPGATRSIRFVASTDSSGRFEFKRLAAGEYVVTAGAAAFISADAHMLRPGGGGTRVVIRDGERYDRANVALRRTSAIEGRVLDEFGDPAPGVRVQVAQPVGTFGLSLIRPDTTRAFRSTGASDDRGWFRIAGLFPADYYLMAIPEPFERSSPGFGITFFPSVASIDAARAVHVVAGMDALDATFKLVPARTATISGVAAAEDGQPAPGLRLILAPTDNGEIRLLVTASATTKSDGTFSFGEVPDGNYVVQGISAALFGFAHVTVGPAPSEPPRPIALTLRGPATVRGRVTFVGGAPLQAPGGVAIVFQPTEFTSGPAAAIPGANRISADWTFEMSGFAQRGVLRVITPPGWALARILSQGRDITDAPFDFPDSDVTGLEVVLTNRVGSVSGTVVSGKEPVPGATVIIFGTASDDWTYFAQSVHPAVSNAQGLFSVSGLLPGRYLVVAVPALNSAMNPASIAALRLMATPVQVSEGTTAVVQLSIVK